MKCLTALATIATVGLLTGCSANTVDTSSEPAPEAASPGSTPRPADPPAAPTKTPAAVTLEIDANLRALRELQVFDLGGVEENFPEGASCYSLACPGHEQEFNDAKARAAEALAAFTSKAIAAAADTSADARIESSGACYLGDQKNLQTLKDLHVIAVGDLVLEKPEAYVNCYSVPGAHKLARIAAAFRKP
jgi:hypothetical protein